MTSTDNKFNLETLLLRALFVVCIGVCGAFLTAMVTVKPLPLQLASNSHVSAAVTHTPAA